MSTSFNTRPVTVQIFSTIGTGIEVTDTFSVQMQDGNDQAIGFATSESGGGTLMQNIALNHSSLGLLDNNKNPISRQYFVLDSTTLVSIKITSGNCDNIAVAFGQQLQPNVDSEQCTLWENTSNNPEEVTYKRCSDNTDRTVFIDAADTICVRAGFTPQFSGDAFTFIFNGCSVGDDG